MAKCLSIGNCNKYFIYIFLSIFFHILNDTLYGFNYNDYFLDVKFIDTETQDYFSWHDLIHKIFSFIGTIFIAYFFNKYELLASQRETANTNNINNDNNNDNDNDNDKDNDNNNDNDNDNDNESENKDKKTLKITLIHNEFDDIIYADNYSFTICFIVIFLWIIGEELIDTFILALKDLDFWMFELIIITIFSIKMFKVEIYKHQIFAMWFCIVPCILKIATIILSFCQKLTIKKSKLTILYIDDKIYIPIGILIYLLLITSRAYVNCKIKWFMDLKYVSPNLLLFYYGIAGSIICTVICIITTFVKCDDTNSPVDIYDYICKIPYNNQTQNNFNYSERYFDSFIFYFDTFRGKTNKGFQPIEVLYEIIIIILGMLTFFFYKFFSLLVIQNLTPIYLIFSNPIYFFLQKTILLVYTFIKEDDFFQDDASFLYVIYKVCLDLSGDLFSIIGFLMYLEIIELKFGNYDYNLKVNIIRRGIIDSFGKNKSLINEEEEKESENESGNESEEDITLEGET